MTRRLRRWLIGLSLGTATLTALTCGTWSIVRARVGEPSAALADNWHEAHRVLDREGRLLREITSDLGLRGQPRALGDLGPRIVTATLASEDRSFFTHDGVDEKAIARALGQSVRHGRLVSGASTITQQLVKLLDSRGQPGARDLADKLREVARAQNLEQVLTKDEILLAYLNRLPYGHGLTGPEAAARAYFGVPARDLSWAQAAFLAVLPRAPSYLDPYTHQDRVLVRQRALLGALHELGRLSALERDRAVAEPIVIRPLTRPFFAPHLVDALTLERRLSPGTSTTTTLDLDLQRDVEGLVRVHLAAIADRGASDAAAIVVDNRTGEVLAYVGSADFHDDEIAGQVDMARARRQPGSTLKPFVYALAFAGGHTGPELAADVPTTFQEPGGGSYTPENFDRGFEGPIPLREALAGSLNIPAIRLAAELGPPKLLGTLHALGFASLDRDADHYGLALALGSGEVALRELAAAYATLARAGRYLPLRFTATDPTAAPTQVFDPATAALVTEALADPLARVRGLHGRGPFTLQYPVAVKTGTSSGYRDTWTVGYTHERTVAVWLGNADGSPTARLTGASGAGPLFADIMRRAMDDVPQRAPLWDPDLLVDIEVCPLSGAPVGPACDEKAVRKFAKGHVPEATCTMHVHVRRDPQAPAGLRCAPPPATGPATTAVLFPPEFDEWLSWKTGDGNTPDLHGRPWLARARVPGCDDRPAALPTLKIVTPAPGSVFALGARRDAQTIEARAEVTGAQSDLGELVFLVDGREVGRSAWPYKVRIAAEPGDHELLARPADPRRSAKLEPTRFSVR